MSGGSYNYTYQQVHDTYVDAMYDKQLNDMIKDLVEVLHDLEWWQSADIGEEDYRQTVTRFKRKWFQRSKTDIQKLVEHEFEEKKNDLLKQLEYLDDSYEVFEECK